MGIKAVLLFFGLLVTQTVIVKNLYAQGVATPMMKPSAASLRKTIPFASQCSFFKGRTKVSRSEALKVKADFILVSKSQRRLVLFANDIPMKTYNTHLGFTPVGHKIQEGGGKTPEGQYRIELKNWNSQFHRSLRVSYPNARDKARARALDVAPGGNIMIHGEHYDEEKRIAIRAIAKTQRKVDWTHGCLAVSNHEIDEIYQNVSLATFIEICP